MTTLDTTVLLVDDHARFRANLRDWLRHTLPQVAVLEAATGEDAVTMADEHRPTIVLMDIGLPGMDGLEATRRIRASNPSTTVIMVSLLNTERHRAASAAAGAGAYVAKGSLPDALEYELRRLLRLRAEDDNAEHGHTGQPEPVRTPRPMGGRD